MSLGDAPKSLIGIHTNYDPDLNENVGTLITPEIHSWIKETVQDLAKYAPREADP